MKLKLKEDPKEWRKITLMSAMALAVFSSLLRWRHKIPASVWVAVLALLAIVAIAAVAQPRWFRGYYRISNKLGFAISQFAGAVVLAVFFFVIITPLGLAMRLIGKDPLRLRRPNGASSHWSKVEGKPSLDRLF